MQYFKRQNQLWQENNLENVQESLASKSIAIIGAGGLGSALAYALGASGIGKIYVVDFDKVSLSNIHRQIMFEQSDVGEDKAAVFRKLKRRYDGVQILPYIGEAKAFFREQFSYDLILDATDNLAARQDICKGANALKLPWIFASVEGFHTQVCFMRGRSLPFKDAPPPGGIAAPIVMLGASFSANLALRYLVGLSVEENTMFYLDLGKGGMQVRSFALGSDA